MKVQTKKPEYTTVCDGTVDADGKLHTHDVQEVSLPYSFSENQEGPAWKGTLVWDLCHGCRNDAYLMLKKKFNGPREKV